MLVIALLAVISVVVAAASIGRTAPTIHRNHVVATLLAGHLAASGPAGTSRLSLGTEEAIVKSTSIDLGRPAEAAIPPGEVGGCRLGEAATASPVDTCTSRRQVTGELVVDPTRPNHLLAGQNDGRDGYSHCMYYYTRDSGISRGDGVPPFLQRTNQGTVNDPKALPATRSGHSYDTASDPAVAFDSSGQGYIACAVFDINSAANGIYLSTATETSTLSAGPVQGGNPQLVTEANNPGIFNDSPALAADWHVGSPLRDHLYVAWSRLACDVIGACRSPIYLSGSSDRGQTWSVPVRISGRGSLCGGECDLDQGASIATGPDGVVSVAFNNANAADPNVNQQLLVQSSDGGRSWSAPVRIGDDYLVSAIDRSSHPTCDLGLGPEQCVPSPTSARLRDAPRIGVDSSGRTLTVVWQDYRNGVASNENYDVIEATSDDGGATWATRSLFVEAPPGSAQFDPSVSINQAGGAIAISYYDRGLNNDLANSRIDYVLSVASSPVKPLSRLLASVIPTPLPEGVRPALAGFSRTYTGPVWSGTTVLLLWSDGRRLDPNRLPKPNGQLSGPGVIAFPT